MTNRAVTINDLESVRVTTDGGETLELTLGRGRVSSLAPIAGRHVDLASLLERAFYGGGPGIDRIRDVELRFAADVPVVLRRHLASDAATLRIGGRLVDTDACPGEHLLGTSREAFARALCVDGRHSLADALEYGVAAALGRDVAVGAGLERGLDESARIAVLTSRIDAIRAEMKSLPPLAELDYTTSDPPALGRLIAAIDETREVEKRLLRRRLDLAEKLETIPPSGGAGATPPALLDAIERRADELEDLEAEIAALATRAVRGSAHGIVTVTMIVVVAVGGLALMGRELGDDVMFEGGLAAAALALISGVGAGLLRARSIVSATRRLKTLREREDELRKKALNTCRRVGAPADTGDVEPDTLRRIADRARSRDTARDIQRTVAPFIDTPAELEIVRELSASLDRPLGEAGSGGPQAPIARASSAVVDLARQWVEHADETARRIEAASRDRVVHETEREILKQSLVHLEKERNELESKRTAGKALAESCTRLARRLDREVVPVLRRVLCDRAPVGFDATLEPIGRGAATPADDAAILTVARLVLADGLGATGLRIARELTCGLDDAVAARLLEWCLTAPQSGRFIIAPLREADDRALEMHARDLAASHAPVLDARPVRPQSVSPEAGMPSREPIVTPA